MENIAQDPVAPVILGVTGIVFFAIVGRVAVRLRQSSVLGELAMGVLLGNLGYLVGIDLLIVLREGPAIFELFYVALDDVSVSDAANSQFGARAAQVLAILQGPQGGPLVMMAHVVDVLSRYGVILLLFLVGLDNSVRGMKSVGAASIRVASIGVVVPLVLVLAAVVIVAPSLSWSTSFFIAATFVATSVGITASVLEEIKADATVLDAEQPGHG